MQVSCVSSFLLFRNLTGTQKTNKRFNENPERRQDLQHSQRSCSWSFSTVCHGSSSLCVAVKTFNSLILIRTSLFFPTCRILSCHARTNGSVITSSDVRALFICCTFVKCMTHVRDQWLTVRRSLSCLCCLSFPNSTAKSVLLKTCLRQMFENDDDVWLLQIVF